MYYGKLTDGKVTHCNIADEVPFEVFTVDTSEETLARYNVVVVNDPDPLDIPTYNPDTHGLVDTDPVLGSDNKWYARYSVVEKGPEPELLRPPV
jgi:hypothetical protein